MENPGVWAAIYLAVAVGFGIGELVLPSSLYLLPFAVGALASSIVSLMGAGPEVSFPLFLVASFAVFLGFRPLARRLDASSFHITFLTESEWKRAAGLGFLERWDQQFHWRNAGYADFDAFLATLAQPKRKKIRAERRKVAEAGVRLRRLHGREIGGAHWAFFSRCYESTYAAHHATPYLNLELFERIGEAMPEHLVLVLAERDGRPVASSLLVHDDERLYGRYWGAIEPVPRLHFEACYYQAIETAIEVGLRVVEGGAQGEHKVSRGFDPVPTVSAHWLADPAFAQAVDRFLQREDAMVGAYLDELRERSPYRAAPTGTGAAADDDVAASG